MNLKISKTITFFLLLMLKLIYQLININASVAQSAARQSHNLKAVSSSLTRGIPLFNDFY